MSNYVNGNNADNNWRNDDVDGQQGRYVPPARRNRLDDVPEGTQAKDYSQQPQQYASRRGGSYNNSQQMRKSQSFASGVQNYDQMNQIPPQQWNGGYGPPPAQGRGGSYSQRGGRGGNRGGAGGPRRDDINGGRGGGQRPQYAGRFSYDQRNVHDEQQWAQSNQNSRWSQLDQPDQHYGGPGHHNQGGNNAGYNGRGPSYGHNHPAAWQRQDPPDLNLESELFSGMNSGINFDKYEDIPVEATGEDCPAPISSFVDLELHEWVQENIRKSGYDRPTPVQKYSIPTLNSKRDLMSCAQTGSGKTAAFLVPVINQILKGGPGSKYSIPTLNSKRDLMSCAQTGSGKTAAFLVPVINQILKGGPGSVRKAEVRPSGRTCQFPLALIISPTRELSLQIYNESRKFAYRTPVTSALLYGGRENYRDQINKLRLGVHILIATPGRLIDVIQHGYIALDECRFLVLDEADRMLDMGFEPQIRQIVELNNMPRKGERVTAMFSATFPKEIQMLAQDFLMPDYVFLAVGRVGSTSENITQEILWVEEGNKRHVLRDLLDANDPNALTLIFVETKRGASGLAETLCRDGYNVVAIHGDLKQVEREMHLDSFRTGRSPILVATAVAARGLDIPNVKYVINYDLPNDIDEYVHRIGRTGRVGNTGFAKSFLNEKNRNIARELAELLVEANQEIPDWFEKFVSETQRFGVRGARGRGGNTNVNRFGGRDHRVQYGTNQMGNGMGGSMRYNPTPSYAAPPPQQYWNGQPQQPIRYMQPPMQPPTVNPAPSNQKSWWE
uniref:RNA helicase n=1 Tax=Panagrolaimus sp. JU765 TaxID=591449 RepID=A0AC34QD42_9BILA